MHQERSNEDTKSRNSSGRLVKKPFLILSSFLHYLYMQDSRYHARNQSTITITAAAHLFHRNSSYRSDYFDLPSTVSNIRQPSDTCLFSSCPSFKREGCPHRLCGTMPAHCPRGSKNRLTRDLHLGNPNRGSSLAAPHCIWKERNSRPQLGILRAKLSPGQTTP